MHSWVEDTIQSMGYLGVTFLMFLENVFPPIPSELVMPLSGYAVAQGELTLGGVIVGGTAGSVLGAVPLYFVGKWLSEARLRRFAARHGHWLMLSEKDFDKAMDTFGRHGRKMVFFGRLIPGVRSLISIPAGLCKMRLAPFLLWTAAGAAIWTALLAWAGFVLGERYDSIGTYVGWATYLVVGGLVVWYVVYVVRGKRRKRRRVE